MGLEFVLGGNTAFNEDIRFLYIPPKKELDLKEELEKKQYNSLLDLKNAFTNASLVSDATINNEIKGGTYWEKEAQVFYGKEAITDSYTKTGQDMELTQYFDRQLINRETWIISTSSAKIDFKAGGKILFGNREYIIIRLSNQYSKGNTQNMIKAIKNTALLRQLVSNKYMVLV